MKAMGMHFIRFVIATVPVLVWLCICLALAAAAIGDVRDLCRSLAAGWLIVGLVSLRGGHRA